VIELKHITKTYGDRKAVDDVTLSIPKGQICGYLGPNGAGKTTTVKMIIGMIRPTTGDLVVAGFSVLEQGLEVKRRIGCVPESGALYQSLTPWEYLEFIGRMYRIPEDDIGPRIREFGDFFDFKDVLHTRMIECSKGMRQKVVITSALIHNPDVIVFDEPLSGLDANSALRFKEVIRNLANQGKTIFYCSHILDVVENLCDRVVILDQGRIVADGSVAELKGMTRRSSLEGVFSRLTHAEDVEDLAKAFSKRITRKPS